MVAAVSALDNDPDVDGVLVQLPLPHHVCTATVLR
jgi:5,10-methylene-tetrahydrofolate dehydrogenase/methenyl tetrahydrofolate cyclohydrolase